MSVPCKRIALGLVGSTPRQIRPGQVRMTDRSTPPVLPGLAGSAPRTGQSDARSRHIGGP